MTGLCKVEEMQNFSSFIFHSFIYGLIEREKLITDVYFLFQFNHYFAEKNAKQVEQLQTS